MPSLSPDQIPEKWGAIASDYERAFEGLTSQLAADVLGLLDLRRGEKVLDVAAGTGAFSLLAARAGAEVLATDFAPGMVARLRERIAERRLSGISARVMDGQALMLPDASFDACVSILGLIFFPDIGQGLWEMRRVLRPGGRAAIAVWNDARNLRLMTLMIQSIRKVVPEFHPPEGAPVWARLAGADAVRAALEGAGFREVETTTSVRQLRIDSPETFWSSFTSSAPPLAYLFQQLGPERTEAVGREYIESLRAASPDGIPAVEVEVCLGMGKA